MGHALRVRTEAVVLILAGAVIVGALVLDSALARRRRRAGRPPGMVADLRVPNGVLWTGLITYSLVTVLLCVVADTTDERVTYVAVAVFLGVLVIAALRKQRQK